MKKYRVTFIAKSGRDDDDNKYDVEAESMDAAFHAAYKLCESKFGYPHGRFSDAQTEEIPEGISNIGLRFRYIENGRRSYCNYMVVRAEGERQAKEWYNKNLKGMRFMQPWPNKPDERGSCVYGEVAETYFAACPGYDFDASSGAA